VVNESKEEPDGADVEGGDGVTAEDTPSKTTKKKKQKTAKSGQYVMHHEAR